MTFVRRSALCLILLLTAALGVAQSQALPDYTALVSVEPDGSAVIVETFTGPPAIKGNFDWQAPTRVSGPLGINRPLVVRVLEVSDGAGSPLPYRLRTYSDHVQVRVQHVAPAVKITYSLDNLTRFLTDHDEFFWTLGGAAGKDAHSASLTFYLPDAAAGQLQAQVFISHAGSLVGPLPLKLAGAQGELQVQRPLTGGEELALDVVLPKGVLKEPWALTRVGWFLEGNPILLFPFVVLAAMLTLSRIKRTTAASIVPQYEPPEGLTPAEVGTLLDDKVDPRDITATLVDLAVRGYIKIEPCEPDPEVSFTGQDYVLRLLKPLGQWGPLAAHENAMLFHTFYGGQWTKLSSLTLRFYEVVYIIQRQVMTALYAKGMYRIDPRFVHAFRIGLMLLVLVVLNLAHLLGWVSMSQSPELTWLVLLTSTAVVYFFSRNLTPKTLRGVRACNAIRGFQEFLNTVEADRLERMPADSFQRFLPYAMAMGVEHHWTGAFAGVASLDWFGTLTDDLDESARFHLHFKGFTQAAHHAVMSAPRAAQGARSRLMSDAAARSGWTGTASSPRPGSADVPE